MRPYSKPTLRFTFPIILNFFFEKKGQKFVEILKALTQVFKTKSQITLKLMILF